VCEDVERHSLQSFAVAADLERAAGAQAARDACEHHCLGDPLCWGCSAHCATDLAYGTGAFGTDCAWHAVSACHARRHVAEGFITGDVTRKNIDGGEVRLTATGPADVWFGFGLNATLMASQPYALVINEDGVMERRLGTCPAVEGNHCPGAELEQSIQVVSNEVVGGLRTVVMTRSVRGLTKDHYSFKPEEDTIHMITAIGRSPKFAYHDRHGPAVLSLLTVGSPVCICDLGEVGRLCEKGGVNCRSFERNCKDPGPLVDQKNPTCSSATYAGGLNCCMHKKYLLDEAQAEESKKRDVLRYHQKYRFWFQEYTKDPMTGKASHTNLDRIYYQTEADAGEYDIPPAFQKPGGPPIVGYEDWPLRQPTPGTTCTGTCPDGPDCACEHTIVLTWTVDAMRIIYAGGHCHAPSCISMELFYKDLETGSWNILCSLVPKYGAGSPADRFDEKGFVALPPCLWSEDRAEGLEKPVWLPNGTELKSVKKNRNTHRGHYGEMASWQMRGVSFPAAPQWTPFI